MEVHELSEWLKRDIDEIKSDQKEQCRMLKDLNGRVRTNTLNVRGLWAVLGGAWTVFLIWFRGKMVGG